jgi:N-acetylneuraminic acid mutarotase
MKRQLFAAIFSLLFIFQKAYSQTNANYFTWLKGASIIDQPGYFGTQGIAHQLNTPGARRVFASWQINNKFYIYGGAGIDGAGDEKWLNDLWEYDADTNNWRWLNGQATGDQAAVYGAIGVPSATNTPGFRSNAITWEHNGFLYLFGGEITGVNYQSDLWKYDLINNIWTWIKGPNSSLHAGNFGVIGAYNSNNNPSARGRAGTWKFNNKFYLFGGDGVDSNGEYGKLNDIWEYDPLSNNWRWIKGSKFRNETGIYGTQGLGSISNIPGARSSGGFCQIENKFFLFGGYGYPENGEAGFLNDLWEYNVNIGEWKYLKGEKTINNNGLYNSQGIFNASTKPGSRVSAVLLSNNNKLYLFGGSGFDINDVTDNRLNDLFIYDTRTNNWVWQRGSENSGGNGSFGMQGVTNSTNRPSARSNHSGWYYNQKLYFFGGTSEIFGHLNDLWSYVIPCSGATDFYSLKNGNWNDPTTWSCGRVPVTTEKVAINGHTITVNGNFGVGGIEFNGGTLNIPVGSTLTYYPIVP